MKLVIDIPNYDYEYITNGCIVPIKPELTLMT